MIVDRKLEKECTNEQTSFYIKKLEKSRKTDTSILAQKSPSPIICRTPSELIFAETEYQPNEITTFYEKLRTNYRDKSDEIFCNRTNFAC